MSGNAGEDLPASPETELLLSSRTSGDRPCQGVCMKAQAGEPRDGASSSSSLSLPPPSQDKSVGSSRNAQVEEPSGNPEAVITPSSITVNDAVENDDPPPYAAIPPPYSVIAPPNHVDWPYGPFSFDDSYSTDVTSYTVEMPLAPFQGSRAATAFHPEETNRQQASLPMPLTSYRFFKFSSGLWETWLPGNGITEKIEDRSSRKYGAILMAAAVIISLMALSLMVRFIMERSWWRG